MWRWEDNPYLNPSGIGSTRNLIEMNIKKIEKYLRKKGVDDATINFAVGAYIYFFVLDKRNRKSLAKELGKTPKELEAFYDSVLQYCSQYKGFAKLLKEY